MAPISGRRPQGPTDSPRSTGQPPPTTRWSSTTKHRAPVTPALPPPSRACATNGKATTSPCSTLPPPSYSPDTTNADSPERRKESQWFVNGRPDLGNEDGVMPREKSPGKPTTRRYTDGGEGAGGAAGASAPQGAGDRARDGAAGRPPARLRGRVGAEVGEPGRHR